MSIAPVAKGVLVAAGNIASMAPYETWEILEHTLAVARKNLPHATHRGDFLQETDHTLEELIRNLPDVTLLVAAGFPCQDNSELKKGKKGTKGG